MKILLLCIALSGCSYNAYNDPNIYWPQSWQVDNHADKDTWHKAQSQNLKRGIHVNAINWCPVRA